MAARRPGSRGSVALATLSNDHFLIVDDKRLLHVGASLKDLGRKRFTFTKLNSVEIRWIRKEAFGRRVENFHLRPTLL